MPDHTPPLYVGYLPLPRQHRQFLAALVPLLFALLLAAAAGLALAQRHPGEASWDSATQRTWSGLVLSHPYPMLITDSGDAFLLVGVGKFGVHARVEPHQAEHRSVRGWLLSRDGRKMIELDDAPDAVTTLADDPAASIPEFSTGQPVTLRGEILDGKCYLGAMKPGDGKAHKACAVLCLNGGLPPMFASFDPPPDGDALSLLVIDGSTTLTPELLNLVAEPVLIRGTHHRFASLSIINAKASDIQPLNP